MPNLTKQDFIDRVASKTDLSKRDAGKAVDAFIETVTESLQRGDQITFTGFGKFSTAHRARAEVPGRERAQERRQDRRRRRLRRRLLANAAGDSSDG